MSETPKFLRELEEKHKAALKELGVARGEWERAQNAILKFSGWELTGDRREPIEGDDYLSADSDPEPLHCHVNPSGKYPPEIRFILRKVEPPNLSKYPGWVWTGEYRLPKAGEKILFNNGTFWVAQFDFERDRCYILKSAPVSPELQPDREEAIRKAKSDAYNLRLNTNRFDFPKVRGLVEAVEAIPDREPFPLLDKLREFSELKQNWDSYGSPPITPEALRVARLLCGSPKWIAPVAGGGIAISWDQPDEDPGIEILPSGKLRGDEDEPSPRVAWACPGEILNSLKVFKKTILMDQALGKEKLSLNLSGKYLRLLDCLLDSCRSTREATVEEILRALRGRFSNRDMVLTPNEIIEHLNRAGLTVMKEG